MTKLLAIFLAFAMTLGDALPAWAQSAADSTVASQGPTGAATLPALSDAACEELGRSDGRAMLAAGALVVGFLSGVTFGPVGVTVAWAAQKEPEPPQPPRPDLKDAQCRLAYADAYRHEGRKKKQGGVVLGGVVGTATLLAIVWGAFTHNAGVIP